jgi:hypothetical protein
VYETEVAFMPEANAERSTAGIAALAGLAGQFGFAIGNTGAQSPQFYGDLVLSRTVFDWVLNSPDSCATPIAPLREFFLKDKADDPHAEDKARRRLRAAIDVIVNARTSVITVATRTRSACRSRTTATAVLAAVEDYDRRVKKRRATIRRAFVEELYQQALDTLADRENRLRIFYEENRTWEAAPRLRLQEASLQRKVGLSTEVATVLAREMEQARIAEADDAPLLSLVVAPEVPRIPADHGPTYWFVASAMLSGLAVAVAQVWRFTGAGGLPTT